VKGKVYRACITSVLGYTSDTWAMKVEDMARLERTELMMVRWMCGVHLESRTARAELNSLECVTVVVRRRKLPWFARVERKESDDWFQHVEVLKLME